MKNKLKEPKAFHKLISIYRIIGLLPKPYKKIDVYLAVKFQLTITFLTLFSASGLAAHLKQIMRAGYKYKSDQIDDINAILQCCIAQSYLVILQLVGNKMIDFFGRLEHNKPNDILKVIGKFEKFSFTYYKTTLFMCFVYALDNSLNDSYCSLKDMVEDESTLICGSMIPMWFPIRLNLMVQALIKIVNLFVLMVYFPAALAIPAFGLGSIEMIIARIRHLKWLLTRVKFGNETNEELTKAQLRNCIKYFIETKSLVRDMGSSVSLLFLPQHTLMSTILALLEYHMIFQFSAATVIRFTGWAFMEFVICMKGQDLTNQAAEFAQCVYNMQWYEMHPNIRSMYRIFHMAAQKPIEFQAKPFVPLNSQFLMHVFKTSYSLMMFFRTWSDDI